MRFHPTPLRGVRIVELEERADARGFFARVFCEQEFAAAELETRFPQANTALSARAGTLRGLHYQLPPHAEAKLVRCVAGAIWDVVLDLRPDSPDFGHWFGAELSAENRRMMYVPQGLAHATLSLSDNAEVFYLVSEPYAPEFERGVRWNDPRFAITWPMEPAHLSGKDGEWPDFDPAFHAIERLRGL